MNKLKNATETDLKMISEMIREGEVLLPDFQRGFVWKEEMQESLIASVLAKMPIGSILLLEAKCSDYGCRILGRKDEANISESNTDEDIYVLLDGQQRLTVLTNTFSNLIYYDYSKSGKLMCDYGKLISDELMVRYFLKIPAVEYLTEENDKFHLKDLEFFLENPEKDTPDFLTGDIRPYIVGIKFNKNTDEAYAPHAEKPYKIKNYCIQDEYYLIPLYLLVEDGSSATWLNDILEDMVGDVVKYRLEHEYDVLTDVEKMQFIKKNIEEGYLEEIFEAEEHQRKVLKERWISMGKAHWADKMKRYLLSCVNNLDLHQIVVDAADRNRAIDIYENLNMGGIALSTFELVLAKAAKRKDDNKINLYDAIVDYIQTPHSYNVEILPDCMSKSFKDYIERNQEYSASEVMGCLDIKKNQLNKKYTDAFLNVLSLVSNIPDYQVDELAVSYIKRPKILDLTEGDIWSNYLKVCEGIDRAYYFLQARCGVRKIGEVNYDLMVVLLGYVLANDEYYKNKEVNQLLDAWYWSAIFSGRYDKDQSENVIEDITSIIRTIRGETDKQWLLEMKEKVFNMPGFSDMETLLLKRTVTPKNVIRKKICQFYLAKTYDDLCTNELLSPFCENADTLEEHHIVPIGSMNRTYKTMEQNEGKVERGNKKNIFNSPLNFAFITKKSNLEISNQKIDIYISDCNSNGIFELNIEESGKEHLTCDDVSELLEKRFAKTKCEVEKRIKQNM